MDMDAVKTTVLTERDLLRIGSERGKFEVIDGEIIQMSGAGELHVHIAGNIFVVLRAYVLPRKLGFVFGDNLIYVLHRDSESGVRRTRIPDASFVRKDRIPKDRDISLPFPGAPDLAVEVMSPDDTAIDLLSRVRDYFAYGSEQVWVLYPEQKELHQHIRGDSEIRIYTAADELDANPLIAGLKINVGELFAVPLLE
jgi:Uma2 family endonuclease